MTPHREPKPSQDGLPAHEATLYLVGDPRKCTGCLSCMLVCAVAHEGRAQLRTARILIVEDPFGAYPSDIDLGTCRQCKDPELRLGVPHRRTHHRCGALQRPGRRVERVHGLPEVPACLPLLAEPHEIRFRCQEVAEVRPLPRYAVLASREGRPRLRGDVSGARAGFDGDTAARRRRIRGGPSGRRLGTTRPSDATEALK